MRLSVKAHGVDQELPVLLMEIVPGVKRVKQQAMRFRVHATSATTLVLTRQAV
jgi:hypothetical protein